MNLANGALALSTEAGAYDELAGPAIGLNPFDVSETASALATGLEMPIQERAARARWNSGGSQQSVVPRTGSTTSSRQRDSQLPDV